MYKICIKTAIYSYFGAAQQKNFFRKKTYLSYPKSEHMK